MNLIEAAQAGNLNQVNSLLAQGAAVDQVDEKSQTPLHWAALTGHEDIVAALLAAGAQIDKVDNGGWTPLYWAATMGHEAVVAALLDAGAAVNKANNLGWTPLFTAAAEGHEAIVGRLLQAGAAAVDQAAHNGSTPLLCAALQGHEAVVGRLLEAGAQVDKVDNVGYTPLLLAAAKGHEAIVGRLLQAGAAAVDQAAHNGSTPLYLAAQEGHEAVVGRLIDAGAAVNQADEDGDTPLFVAAQNGHEAIVARLLEAGSGASILSEPQKSKALCYATQKGHDAVVGRLLDAGADVNQANNEGKTPLSIAAQNQRWPSLILLAAYGHRRDNQQKHVLKKRYSEKNSPGEIQRLIESFLPNNTRANIQAIIDTTPNMPEDVKSTLNWMLSKPTDPLHHHALALVEQALAKARPKTPPWALICRQHMMPKPLATPDLMKLIEKFLGDQNSSTNKMLSRLDSACKQDVNKAKEEAAIKIQTVIRGRLARKKAASNRLQRAYRIPRINPQFDQQHKEQHAAQQHDFDRRYGLVRYTPAEEQPGTPEHAQNRFGRG
jgi:ankyrin repeat protein